MGHLEDAVLAEILKKTLPKYTPKPIAPPPVFSPFAGTGQVSVPSPQPKTTAAKKISTAFQQKESIVEQQLQQLGPSPAPPFTPPVGTPSAFFAQGGLPVVSAPPVSQTLGEFSISQTGGAGLVIDQFGFSTTPQKAQESLAGGASAFFAEGGLPVVNALSAQTPFNNPIQAEALRLQGIAGLPQRQQAVIAGQITPQATPFTEFAEEHFRGVEEASLQVINAFARGDNPLFVTTETWAQILKNFASNFPGATTAEQVAALFGYVEISPGVWVPGTTPGAGGGSQAVVSSFGVGGGGGGGGGGTPRFAGGSRGLGLVNWRI